MKLESSQTLLFVDEGERKESVEASKEKPKVKSEERSMEMFEEKSIERSKEKSTVRANLTNQTEIDVQNPLNCGVIHFYHIPSTGGTTIVQWLDDHTTHYGYRDYFCKWSYERRDTCFQQHYVMMKKFMDIIPNDRRNFWKAAQSHNYNYGLNMSGDINIQTWKGILDKQNCSLVSTIMFRDPLKHLLSLISANTAKNSKLEATSNASETIKFTEEYNHSRALVRAHVSLADLKRFCNKVSSNPHKCYEAKSNKIRRNQNDIKKDHKAKTKSKKKYDNLPFDLDNFLKRFFSDNNEGPKSQLDYFLYNKMNKPKGVSAEQKVVRALELLENNFEYVFYQDYNLFADTIQNVTKWKRVTNMKHLNKRNDKLTYKKSDIFKMLNFLERNGDVDFINSIRYKYGSNKLF